MIKKLRAVHPTELYPPILYNHCNRAVIADKKNEETY